MLAWGGMLALRHTELLSISCRLHIWHACAVPLWRQDLRASTLCSPWGRQTQVR